MEPISFSALYALLAASGFISFDSYINSNTVTLEATVAEPLEREGYDKSVVEAVFMSEVTKIVSTPSLAAKPKISTAREKPVSVAAAELIKFDGALRTAQSYVGLDPPWLTASVIVDESNTSISFARDASRSLGGYVSVEQNYSSRVIVTGYSSGTGYFSFSASQADRKFDQMIRNSAWEAVRHLDPYYAALTGFVAGVQGGENVKAIRGELVAELQNQERVLVDADRALLNNLVAITYLLENDQASARQWFDKVVATDPSNPVGWLNLAFMDVQEDRFGAALDHVDKVIDVSYWPLTDHPKLLSSAYVTRGVALGELKRFEEAVEAFQTAIKHNPETSSAYVYWARMARGRGQFREAEELQKLGEANERKFINYPEVALLYFWLTGEGEHQLQPRKSKAERL